MILSSRASRATKTAFSSPYTQNNISYFGGMYRKNKGVPGLQLATYRHAHQKQACTLLYTCVAWFFLNRNKHKAGNTTKRSRVSNSRTISGLSDGFKPLRHTGMNLTTPFRLPFCTPPHAYTPSRCSCQRCKKDNQCPKLFSSDNMDPGSVPAELQGLS